MVVLSARMGVGLACLSLVTFLSALSRVLWLAGWARFQPSRTVPSVPSRAGFQFRRSVGLRPLESEDACWGGVACGLALGDDPAHLL